MRVEEFRPEALTVENSGLVSNFTCSLSKYTVRLADYLRAQALRDAAQDVSRTWLWVSDSTQVGAFVSLSATSIPANKALRAALGTDSGFVPAVMIDYIAVADFVLAEKIHLGRAIFDWVKREVVMMNKRIAVRLIRLDVSVGNWGAYRTYRNSWAMKALPVMTLYGKPLLQRDGTPVTIPNASAKDPPAGVDPEAYVKLWFDSYARA